MGHATNSAGQSIYHRFYNDRSMIHSEAAAFKKVKGLLNRDKNFEVINIRLNKLNEYRVSKPCECCTNFLSIMGCNKVYYTTDEGFESVSL